VEVERALVLDQGASHAELVIEILFGALDRNERTALAQRVVPKIEAGVVADRPLPGLRDDVDRYASRAVVLRGKLIARDADRSDLRLRRQGAALEAVDAEDRARSGHVLQLLPQRRGVVRQRLDRFTRQRRAEGDGLAIRGRGLPVAFDGDRRLD